MMDGPNVNVLAWAGIDLSDEEHDKIFGQHTIESLVELCASADLEVTEEFEGDVPGSSDTFYVVKIDEPEEFKRELRQLIDDLLEN